MRVGYGGIETLDISGGLGINVFDVLATAAGTHTTLKGGAASNAFRITPTLHNLNAIAGPVDVVGGEGDDGAQRRRRGGCRRRVCSRSTARR